MSTPSTSSERSTVGSANAAAARQPDYQTATAAAAAATAAAAAYVQDEAGYALDLSLQQHQQQLAQHQQLAYQQQQAQQVAQQHQHSLHQHLQAQHVQHQQHTAAAQAAAAAVQQQHNVLGGLDSYEDGEILRSKFVENEIVKTFNSKPALVGYVKNVLCIEEQCKIVINSSKPKAIYFQCERSGLFRTTVKDSTKRQRVAYTKRNKCGYRLVANLYPPEKEKKKQGGSSIVKKLGEDDGQKVGFERNLDEKLTGVSGDGQDPNSYDATNEMWILRMINPIHNHAPEPTTSGLKERKRRLRFSRRLVEKPILTQPYELHHIKSEHQHQQLHHHLTHHQHQHQHQQHQLHQQHPIQHHQHHLQQHDTPSVQDPAVIAAIELAPAAAAAISHLQQHHTPVDPNIDPNVDPSVQEHDHAHR